MVLQLANAANPAPTSSAASATVPAAATTTNSSASSSSSSSSPALTPPNTLSTDMQIDSDHQIYYEFVDKRTGDVVFEIPPEALREIGESLNLPLVGGASVHSIDVES